MTSRAAFRRASAEVCSAAGIVSEYVFCSYWGDKFIKGVRVVDVCLLTTVSSREDPTERGALSARDFTWQKCPSQSESRFLMKSISSTYSDITIIMTTDGPPVLRHTLKVLHNGSSRARCRFDSN